MRHNEAYWTGARDSRFNDIYVWVATNEVLPEKSSLWERNFPIHNSNNCVRLWKSKRKLHDRNCKYRAHFICEALCPGGFTLTDQGCFYAENTRKKNWDDAEAACEGMGAHLAILDTKQVCVKLINVRLYEWYGNKCFITGQVLFILSSEK